MCPSFLDSRTLGYEETVIITVATVSVLVVLAVAAFFGYRMIRGELPWWRALFIQSCLNPWNYFKDFDKQKQSYSFVWIC